MTKVNLRAALGMIRAMLPLRALAATACLAAAFPLAASAQDTGTVHDAPFVPSPRAIVEEMLRLAAPGPRDTVADLGSGDGRLVIAAAKLFGARGIGVERDARLVAQSRAAAAAAGVGDRVEFLQQDLFATDLSAATVVTLYLTPNLNLRLRPALLRLRPGTRIVSHASGMGDWQPDRRTSLGKDVMLWVVPAEIAGRWRSRVGLDAGRQLELSIAQRFQALEVEARLDGRPARAWEAGLAGDRVSLVVVEDRRDAPGLYLEGRVSGRAIEGTVAEGVGTGGRAGVWRAERLPP